MNPARFSRIFFHGSKPPVVWGENMNRTALVEGARLSEKLEKMPSERLLPIEKKLILWSVLLGLFLVGALMLVSQVLLIPKPEVLG